MISKKNFAKVSATLGAVALGVSATATAANADTIYTVQSGDTLSGISYKFAKNNSMINDLAKKNNIQDINKIFVGQKLIIKSDGEIQEYNAQNAANANVNTQQAAQQNTQTTQAQQTQNQANQSYTSNASGSEAAAKAWIAGRESGGNYGATNGQYIGKYQLSASYLNGDYSPANQERVADQYVASRYGSWQNAQAHWQANGWY
ncbi:LysM domain-containing protein [Lactobacillus sp. 0.1XD8-4]|uniref:LysM domain-containing protein n=1 Tax=Limosilactobacillus walteri TaxID=2268022 RepID=A0ABR8P8J3_9LACO|nr:LysM peptidoglycan-binding domain-containing protein [Limosilactobacillus walteri]MBD5806992.1 LysM domain-containing protein [Limosilactobacillus walteri]MRN06711.1 LysM domain-containing protein [Lactobacillus sp. 0.1XD8-4]